MKLTFVILSALLGVVSIAAPLPSTEEKKVAARQNENPVSQVTDIASGLLLPVDLKNSGIDKVPAEVEGIVQGGQPGVHPGYQGTVSPGNL